MSKKVSALSALKSEVPQKAGYWMSKLSAAHQAELNEIKLAWKANELEGRSITQIYEWCKDRYGFSVCRNTFQNWLIKD